MPPSNLAGIRSRNRLGCGPVGGSYNADGELSGETYDQDGNLTAASYDSPDEMLWMNVCALQIMSDSDGNLVAKGVTSGGVTTII